MIKRNKQMNESENNNEKERDDRRRTLDKMCKVFFFLWLHWERFELIRKL